MFDKLINNDECAQNCSFNILHQTANFWLCLKLHCSEWLLILLLETSDAPKNRLLIAPNVPNWQLPMTRALKQKISKSCQQLLMDYYRCLQNRWWLPFLVCACAHFCAKLVSIITHEQAISFTIYLRNILAFMSTIKLSRQIWKRSARIFFPYSVPLRNLLHIVWIVTQSIFIVYVP